METSDLFQSGLIREPEVVDFNGQQKEQVYRYLYESLNQSDNKIINADDFINELKIIYELNDSNECRLCFVNQFLIEFPEFYAFIRNMNASARVDVSCSEKVLEIQENPAEYNCSSVKSVSNSLHHSRWTREMELSERQGGVSILGTISELLLQKQLEDLVSDENYFYRSSHMPPQIKAYGDFVIMCQPNNLWLSVKSGFSRERLLASGYTNDVIGIGFFQDATEFTNNSRLRNFKKAGFLAIYVPSVPVTEGQINDDEDTYTNVVDAYNGVDSIPKNINGTPLIRDLSNLYDDLKQLLDMPIRDRHLSDF